MKTIFCNATPITIETTETKYRVFSLIYENNVLIYKPCVFRFL